MLHRVTSIPLVFLIGMIGLAATFPAEAQEATSERPTIDLTVLVLNAEREPVPDAMVSIAAIPARIYPLPQKLVETTSNADGIAELSLSPNPRRPRDLYVIRVEHPEYTLRYDRTVIYPLDREQSRTMILGHGSERSRFRVIDSSGQPVWGARASVGVSHLHFYRLNSFSVEEEYLSDEDGWVSLPVPLGHGLRPVYVTHPGGVFQGTLTEEIVQLEESPARIICCVDADTGETLGGVPIFVSGRYLGVTGANGELHVSQNVITENQYKWASVGGLGFKPVDHRDEEDRKILTVKRFPVIRGQARWQDGTPYLPLPIPSAAYSRKTLVPDGDSWLSNGARFRSDHWGWFGFFESSRFIAEIPLGTKLGQVPLEIDTRVQPTIHVRLKDFYGNDLPFQKLNMSPWGPESDGASIVRLRGEFPRREQWRLRSTEGITDIEVLLGGDQPSEPVQPQQGTKFAVWIPEGEWTLSLRDLLPSVRVKPSDCGICGPPQLYSYGKPLPRRRDGDDYVFEQITPGDSISLRTPSPDGARSVFSAKPLPLPPLTTGEKRVIRASETCPPGALHLQVRDSAGQPIPEMAFLVQSQTSRSVTLEASTDRAGTLRVDHLNRGLLRVSASDGSLVIDESGLKQLARNREQMEKHYLPHPQFADPSWLEFRKPSRFQELLTSPSLRTDQGATSLTLLRRELVRTRFEFSDGSPVSGARVQVLEVGLQKRTLTTDTYGILEIPQLCLEVPVVLEIRDPRNRRYFGRVGYLTGAEIPRVEYVGIVDSNSKPDAVVIKRGPVVRFQLSDLPSARDSVSIIRERRGDVRHVAEWVGDELVAELPASFFHASGQGLVESQLRLLHEDWYSEPFTLKLEPDAQKTIALETKRRESRTYTIEVRGPDGEAVSGVPMWVRPAYLSTHQELPTVSTDGEGRVTIRTKTPVAELQSLPVKDLSQPRILLNDRPSGPIVVELQRHVNLTLHLEGSTVIHEEGVTLAVYSEEIPLNHRRGMTFREIGKLTGKTLHFPVLTANRYHLVISRGRSVLRRVDLGFLTGTIERTIQLEKGCELSGKITLGGKPVSGGRIQVLVKGPSGPAEYTGEVDEQGRYRVTCHFLGESSVKYFPAREPGQNADRYRRQEIELTEGAQSLDLELAPISD